ncbi:MAG TPA: acyl-ACP--UDP-N-acetylglucosamine O-acyltransferase [Bacteroidota bacterium]|nr:acyl-ACP--UDP-N-acetylglucosamine O-acyltransferase [Bacteroidota bacterium]
MSVTVHSTAVVSPKAQLGDNVSVGPFTVIEDDVTIGSGTAIASHALIANGSRIGKECRVHHGAVLGTLPQDLKFRNEITTLEVGDYTTIREYATLNRGTHERWKTTVGSHCFMMAYSHVAHDCEIGSHVILANSVNMGGHVVIEDHAVVGGIVAIHQFTHIGCHSMIGGGFRVTKDVPPYVLAGQEPLAFTGLNLVGLKRRNFPQAVLDSLEKVYRIVYHNQLNVSQALERIKADLPMTEEVRRVVEFIEKSKRGIIWTRR